MAPHGCSFRQVASTVGGAGTGRAVLAVAVPDGCLQQQRIQNSDNRLLMCYRRMQANPTHSTPPAGKLTLLQQLLPRLLAEGHRILIFSQYVDVSHSNSFLLASLQRKLGGGWGVGVG